MTEMFYWELQRLGKWWPRTTWLRPSAGNGLYQTAHPFRNVHEVPDENQHLPLDQLAERYKQQPAKIIAGKTLEEWRELAKQDDCFDHMVPSDLRQLVGAVVITDT